MSTFKSTGVFDRGSPPERIVDPGEAWHLSELSSACGDQTLAAHSRYDPYWGGMWSGGATATWVSRAVAAKQNAAGYADFPASMLLDAVQSAADIVGSKTQARTMHVLTERLAFLGTVHGWRTCNVQQIAAMTGVPALVAPSGRVASLAFSAGLLDIANPSMSRHGTELFGQDALYRPGRPEAFEQLAKHLTWAEWTAITGGQPWVAGSQHDRHNILATELGLRLAEYAEVGTVLGERFSTVDLLAGSGAGRAPILGDQRAADMTVVRPDGMRIAVELTASISPHFDRKVEKWVQLLSESPMATTGLTVIFLVAQPIEEIDAPRFRARTHQAVMRAVRKHPGFSLERTALRIGVASWREWFPSPHTATEAFLVMRAHRPVDGWTDADFLDDASVPFAPTDPAAMRAVIDNASMLGQTPHWLRDPDRAPSVIPELLAAHGLTEIPAFHTGSPRSNAKIVHPLDKRGVAGIPKPPKRLLGLGR